MTPREHDIARLVAVGMTNKEIAHELILSPRTIDHHVENLRRELGARNRAHLAAIVVRKGEPA